MSPEYGWNSGVPEPMIKRLVPEVAPTNEEPVENEPFTFVNLITLELWSTMNPYADAVAGDVPW